MDILNNFGMENNVAEEFFILYIILMLFSGIFSLAFYVLQSYGLYSIAKRRGIKNPWLSWIPVGNMWMLGCISDQYHFVARGTIKNKRKTLMVLSILLYVFMVIFFVCYFVLIIQTFNGLLNDAFVEQMMGTVIVLALVAISLFVASIAIVIIEYIALYDLYNSCDPSNSVLYLVLSILVNITMPIFVFACRKKDNGMPARTAPAYIPPVQE